MIKTPVVQELCERVERLEEALGFYASWDNWQERHETHYMGLDAIYAEPLPPLATEDAGDIARAAMENTDGK